MKTTGESFQMTSGSVQGVQEREQDIWKKVCEQLTDITSGMSEEEKQDYEKKNSGKIATRCELICRGVKLSENSQSRIISKCNACKNSKTTIERAVKTL